MDSPWLFPEHFKLQQEVCKYYVEHRAEPDWLWRLCKPDFLSESLGASGSPETQHQLVLHKVQAAIVARRAMLRDSGRPVEVKGRFLRFDYPVTMSDCIAMERTKSFFDSDDTPPPEFWVGASDSGLVAFIPDEFIPMANIGIECTSSGCLSWIEVVAEYPPLPAVFTRANWLTTQGA